MRTTPRIDAHHHLWRLESGLYQWPTPADAAIYRTFSADELVTEMRGARLDASIIVQVTDSLADTDSMIAAADANPWIAGVVGWLPLMDRNQAELELDARRGRLHGVRHLIHRETDPEWLLRGDVQPGLELLAKHRLPFDVVAVHPHHLSLVPAVASAHPDLILVIDHLAKPPFRAAGWDEWVSAIRRAGQLPSVRAKLSGLDTAAGPGWTVDELRPAWDVALEAFGPARLMFGSDWPVCRLVSSYRDVVDATQQLVAGLTPSEQDRVLGGTAVEVYRLVVTSSAPAEVAS